MPSRARQGGHAAEIREALQLGDLFFEKCTLQKSSEAFERALELSKKDKDYAAVAEALTGLIRLANEALDDEAIERLDAELTRVQASADPVPGMLWYCKGAIARHRNQISLAQRHFHRCLRSVRVEPDSPRSGRILTRDDGVARAWSMLAIMAFQRGRTGRSKLIGERVLARFGDRCLKRINGNLYLLLGRLAEQGRDLEGAMRYYQTSHGEFLSEHNWYYHLHVLYGYARVARLNQRYAQAYWYLDLIEKATQGSGFASLQREVRAERSRLEQDAVDILIDSRKGIVKTRDGGQISLRKQYVLLNILEALSNAPRGLSKAEIIEKVWREQYRPEAHDNKLYYNINRLRKLLEPDMRQPQYLQNWREGYRLAPGLRVQLVSEKDRDREAT